MKKKVISFSLCVLFLFGCSLGIRQDEIAIFADAQGETEVFLPVTKTETEPVTQPEADVPAPKTEDSRGEPEHFAAPLSHKIAGVPQICQYPNFPTGCESASAVMALTFAGEEISLSEFVDGCLEKDGHFEMRGGKLYGPDPFCVFAGSPRDATSFGCMAPVIRNAMEKVVAGRRSVLDLTGQELGQLCRDHVAKDRPVMVWVTMAMYDTYPGVSWYLENGEYYQWPANEHCMVLIGYDEESYYFIDPMKGKEVSYSRELVSDRFEKLGKQALVLI